MKKLISILNDIAADNYLSQLEIIRLKEWLNDNSSNKGNPLFDKLNTEIEKILADGIIEKSEMDYIFSLIANEVEVHKEKNDIKDNLSINKKIAITGEFIIGDEKKVKEIIENNGGIYCKSFDENVDYLIVAQPEYIKYKNGSISGRIKKALSFIEKGYNIKILSEEEMLLIIAKRNS